MSHNKEKIYDLVKNHFSLSEESLSLFKERLFNPVIDEVYKSFGLDENYRKHWLLDLDSRSKIDTGWTRFKDLYKSFCKYYNVSYTDFSENKITDKRKNRVKMKKALLDFYIKNEEEGVSRVRGTAGRVDYLSSMYEGKVGFTMADIEDLSKTLIPFSILREKHDASRKKIIEIMEETIGYELDYIGSIKLPNKDLYLVLSCNFEDWFFCSTGDNWSSCLGLNSGYNYWLGLPNLIMDTNRAMIYLTDRNKKYPLKNYGKEYKNVNVERIISRTWTLLREDDAIGVVGFYPNDLMTIGSIKDTTGYKKIFSISFEGEGASKNKFRLLYFVNGFSTTIYLDNTPIRFESKLDKKEEGDEGSLFKYSFYDEDDGSSYPYNKNKQMFEDWYAGDFEDGLDGLVHEKKSLGDYINKKSCFFCSVCDVSVYEVPNYIQTEGLVCSECLEKWFFKCDRCGNIFDTQRETLQVIEGYSYCELCAWEVNKASDKIAASC